MYSRQYQPMGNLPPDYGGVAYRNEPDPPSTDPLARPRRPLYSPTENEECREQTSSPKKREVFSKGKSSLSERKFSLEDIALAGIILLLLNKEQTADGDLLLILGFLLLTGL